MTTSRRDRILAAMKAAKTRRSNLASQHYYEEFTRPANERIQQILNHLLSESGTITLEYHGQKRLKNGALYGDLITVRNRMFLVKPFGYSLPKMFQPKDWEPVLR